MVNYINYQPWQLISGWMNHSEANKWKNLLCKQLDWEQPFVNVYGKNYLIPRKTVFIGNKDISYSYSGLRHIAVGWPDWFKPLLDRICLTSKIKYNGCLLNLYRNGQDRMGWHSDDEKEIDSTKSIASLSLGSSRDFCFKHRKRIIKETIRLSDGDLLIMNPGCQKDWLHCIPARKKVLDLRINLTFRLYK